MLADPPDFGMLDAVGGLPARPVRRRPARPPPRRSASRCSSPRTAAVRAVVLVPGRPAGRRGRDARRGTRAPATTVPADPGRPGRFRRRAGGGAGRPGRRSGRCRGAASPRATCAPGLRRGRRSTAARPACRDAGGWTTSSPRCPTRPTPRRASHGPTNQTPVPTALRRTSTTGARRGPRTRSVRCSGARVMPASRASPTRAAATAARSRTMTTGSRKALRYSWLLDDLVDRIRGGEPCRARLQGRPAHRPLVGSRRRGWRASRRTGGRTAEPGAKREQAAVRRDGRGRRCSRWTRRFLLVTTAGDGTALAVVVPADADLGQVAYEINRLVQPRRRRTSRSDPPRPSAGTATPAPGGARDLESRPGSTATRVPWSGPTPSRGPHPPGPSPTSR